MQSLENQLYNPMLYQIWSTGAPFGTLAVVDDDDDTIDVCPQIKFYLLSAHVTENCLYLLSLNPTWISAKKTLG